LTLVIAAMVAFSGCSKKTGQAPGEGTKSQTSSGVPGKIPLRHFFDNPQIAGGQISPDGTQLAFLAPATDPTRPNVSRLNIWVCDIEKGLDSAHQITADYQRGIMVFFWTRDSKYILYAQDQGGDENYHLYRVEPSKPQGDIAKNAFDLTPFKGVRAGVVQLPKERPDEALITLNIRNKKYFDVYRIKISSGDMLLLEKNPGDVDGWQADTNGVIRACVAKVANGGTEIRVRNGSHGPFRKLATYTDEENADIEAFGKDGSFLYFSSARGSDTTRLVKLDLKTGKESPIAYDPHYDLAGVLISDVTDELVAAIFERDRMAYQSFDPKFTRDLEILGKVHDGDVMIRSSDAIERKFIVSYNSPTDPGATYLYDRSTGEAKFLYRPRPWLKSEDLAPMNPVEIKSRDGLTLHGYLTLPKGVAHQNLPLVLVVHGGPWARDSWGYDPEAQFLANRGYAVLQVNFRGSTGYGKKFLHAGDREWGGKMLDDLIDSANWAVEQGFADKNRLSIYGGSYGGYATLAALAFRPEIFRCGVDYVGISNLLTFMNTIPPYWEVFRETLYRRVGHPKKDAEFLRKRSPLYAADQIRAPLFIAQGYNDPRVNHAESEQMVEALKKKNLPVEYLVKMDEGHGFANPENRMEFYELMEKFLEKHLKPSGKN
jgi:dipeptidyl aminopeptidase/acylaminoacyl peptidase